MLIRLQGGVVWNNPEMHALEVGAANGIGTARALAKLFCIFSTEKLLSKATLDQLATPVVYNQLDNTVQHNITQGHGFFHSKNPKVVFNQLIWFSSSCQFS